MYYHTNKNFLTVYASKSKYCHRNGHVQAVVDPSIIPGFVTGKVQNSKAGKPTSDLGSSMWDFSTGWKKPVPLLGWEVTQLSATFGTSLTRVWEVCLSSKRRYHSHHVSVKLGTSTWGTSVWISPWYQPTVNYTKLTKTPTRLAANLILIFTITTTILVFASVVRVY